MSDIIESYYFHRRGQGPVYAALVQYDHPHKYWVHVFSKEDYREGPARGFAYRSEILEENLVRKSQSDIGMPSTLETVVETFIFTNEGKSPLFEEHSNKLYSKELFTEVELRELGGSEETLGNVIVSL